MLMHLVHNCTYYSESYIINIYFERSKIVRQFSSRADLSN